MHMIVFRVTPIAALSVMQRCTRRVRKRLVTIPANNSSSLQENGFNSHHTSLSLAPHGSRNAKIMLNRTSGLTGAIFDQGKNALLMNGVVNGGSAERSHLSPIRNGFVNSSHDKSWSQEKKQKMDACTMTDISLGTGHIEFDHIFSDSTQEKGVKVLDSLSQTPDSQSHVPAASQNTQTLPQSHANLCLSQGQSCAQVAAAATSTFNPFSESAKLSENHDSTTSDDSSTAATTVEEWKQAQEKAFSKPLRGRPRRLPGGKKLPLAVEDPVAEYIVSIPRRSLMEEQAATEAKMDGLDDMSLQARRIQKRNEIQLLLDGDKPKDEWVSREQLPLVTAEDIKSRQTRSANISGSSTRRIATIADPSSAYPMLSWSQSTSQPLPANPRKRPHSDPILTDTSAPMEECDTTSLAKRHAPHHPVDPNVRGEPYAFPIVSCTPQTPPAVPLLSTSDVYCAEFVAFDSRQECQLVNGEYELLLQKCPSEEKKMEDELYTAWDTVFGMKVLLQL